MDYFALRCFVAVVRAGSFSKAAGRLYRSQPAVSLQVRKLERELKQPLFDRFQKKVVLTDAGRILYQGAREALEKIDLVKQQVSQCAGQLQGTLTIVSNLSLIESCLAQPVAAFRCAYPGVQVVIGNQTNRGIAAQIVEGHADIGVGFLVERCSQISELALGRSEFVLVTKRPLPSGTRLEDLAGQLLIHFEPGVDLLEYVRRHAGRGVHLDVSLALPSISSVLQYVASGMGYTIVPEFAVARNWKGRLFLRRLPRIPPLVIAAYTNSKRIQPLAAKAFLALLRRQRSFQG